MNSLLPVLNNEFGLDTDDINGSLAQYQQNAQQASTTSLLQQSVNQQANQSQYGVSGLLGKLSPSYLGQLAQHNPEPHYPGRMYYFPSNRTFWQRLLHRVFDKTELRPPSCKDLVMPIGSMKEV